MTMTITEIWLHRTQHVVARGILILATSGWLTPAEADELSPVAKLTSDFVSVQESGVREILEQRREMIDRLIEFLRSGDKNVMGAKRASLLSAVKVLGELRASEAAETLVSYIDYASADRDAYFLRTRLPSEDYPAVKALINIGRPSIPAILHRLPELLAALQGEVNQRARFLRNCVWVLFEIEGPEAMVLHLKLAQEREKDPGRRAGIEALFGALPKRLQPQD